MNKRTERRKHKRFRAKDGLFAVISHGNISTDQTKCMSMAEIAVELYKSKPSKMGQIVDISKEGISFCYIHEKQNSNKPFNYLSEDFANINFGEYIKNLANGLFTGHGVDTNQIKLNIDIKDVSLDLENAIPYGLIINELVSNSLKHAFPDTRKGEIEISLHTINENEFELTVSDDGVGISEDLEIENTDSMGLHLVRVLSEQTLEGKMELIRTEGTRFHFLLKRSQYKPRI